MKDNDRGKTPNKANNNKIVDALLKNKYALIVVLAGIFLLLLPTGGGSGGAQQSAAPEPQPSSAQFSLAEQERRIAEALSRIDGAGEVTVVLTLRSSVEQVVAQDRRDFSRGEGSGEQSESTVIITTGSQQQSPVALKYIYPEFLGALVVAQGADNAAVRLELLSAVATLTGLGTDRITVTRMTTS